MTMQGYGAQPRWQTWIAAPFGHPGFTATFSAGPLANGAQPFPRVPDARQQGPKATNKLLEEAGDRNDATSSLLNIPYPQLRVKAWTAVLFPRFHLRTYATTLASTAPGLASAYDCTHSVYYEKKDGRP